MSEREQESFDYMLQRVDRLIKFAYFIGSCIFILGVWVAKQEFTDSAQWESIKENRAQLSESEKWENQVNDKLSRIDERTTSTNEAIQEIKNEILRLRDK